MKYLLPIIGLTIGLTPIVFGQNANSEREFRAFLAEYDKAVSSRDIGFLEKVIPEDYVLTGTSGRKTDRTRILKYFAREKEKPSYRMNSLVHENVTVRLVGNVAIVTNDYTSRTSPIDPPEAEPQVNKGRHTGVFEKRKGHWMVIAEQDTEQPHDDKIMELQVLKAGREYNDLMKRLKSGHSYPELLQSGDIALLKRVLADEYTNTSRDGELSGKAEDLESYKTNRITIDSADFLEQKVRIVDNNTAVETGKIRYIGTNSGKPFDITKRYTTTWVFWDDRWQIISDHTSAVK